MGYVQSYFTLRTILFEGIPPPTIHIALKLYKVSTDLPIGKITLDGAGKELEHSEEDRVVFDEWIRSIWREKEARFERYYATGSLTGPDSHVINLPAKANGDAAHANGTAKREIELPLKLRSNWEFLDAFALPGPLLWSVLTGKQ